MAFTFTRQRLFHRESIHLAEQPTSGTPISDFTSGTGQMILARACEATEGQEFQSFQGTHGSNQERTGGFINTVQKPQLTVEFYPTPTAIKEFLKSLAGPFVGSAVTFPLNIASRYSFLFAEAEDGAAGHRAYRLEDAWVRRLEFETGVFGVALCRAIVIGEKVTEFDTDAVGLSYSSGVTDDLKFAHISSELIKDPDGPAISLSMINQTVILEHGFDHDSFNRVEGVVTKQGFMTVTGRLDSRYTDETVAIRQEALASTYKKYRHRLKAGSKELRFDFNNVAWSVPPVGYRDERSLDFNGDFRSGTDDPAVENAVDIFVIE